MMISYQRSEYTYRTKSTLLVSYLEYQTLRVILHGEAYLSIPLNPSQTILNQMIDSASRAKTDCKEAPMAISTISSTSIADTKATELDQLLNQTAGVYRVDLGNEQHTMAIRQPLRYNDYYLSGNIATTVEYQYGANLYPPPGQLVRFQAGVGVHFGQ